MSSVQTVYPIDLGRGTEFLRSVNVKYDIETSERIAHFHPTSKSIPLIRSLVFSQQSESLLVVAPYGSGKSLLATFVGQVVENHVDHSHILQFISERAVQAAPEVSISLRKHLDPGQLIRPSGLALVLNGYQQDLGKALLSAYRDALKRIGFDDVASDLSADDDSLEDVLRLLADHKPILKSAGAKANTDIQKIVVLWDEFGRHLEELIANGDAARLNEVQQLAEFVSRQRTIPYSLAVFLHQSLANYASGLSQTVRKEWKKIEGRFEIVQFVDDSRELTALVGEIINTSRAFYPEDAIEKVSSALPSIRSVGLFADLNDEAVTEVLVKAYPIEPTTLYLLPRVSARVAQNERTLFSFLFSVDLRQPVGPTLLFDYFEDSMRGDTGVGGSYHQWLETQNAIEKTTSDDTAHVLKTAGLLGLGISGERSRVGKGLLEFAAAGYRMPIGQAKKAVDSLINQKLLLYRRSTDQVAIWHGVDIDLRGRLDQEKARIGLSFDVIEFISEEVPPRPVLPLEYNAEYQMTRYLPARYVQATGIDEALVDARARIDEGQDGVVLYLVPDDAEDLTTVTERIRSMEIPDRVVVTIPRRQVPIYDAALEVFTLRKMQDDDALTNEDPLVLPELRQMTDDALEYLRRSLLRLTEPGDGGPLWYYAFDFHEHSSNVELRTAISDIMRSAFSHTPRINNELIVRKRPRQVIVNARKSLIGGIMDRYGQEDFGIEGNRPDRSMLNTVLLHTGLYVRSGDTWHFASPSELQDRNLRAVWERFKKLVSRPSKNPKDLKGFFEKLQAPPVGLRPGLFPILLSAAFRAFPSVLSITKDGSYVPDITQSVVESLCDHPEWYEFVVLEMDEQVIDYLARIRGCFQQNTVSSTETDHLRKTYDVVQAWLAGLPPAALSSRRVSPQATRLRGLLTRIGDPVDLFLKRIPKDFGDGHAFPEHLESLRGAVEELEAITETYYSFAETSLMDALKLRASSDVVEQVRNWTELIPADAAATVTNSVAKALYTRFTISYDSPHRLIDSIASLLVDKTVNRWDDSTLSAFDRALRSAISQLEEYAMEIARQRPATAGNLSKLAVVRMKNLYGYLKDILGQDDARKTLLRIVEEDGRR